LPHLSPEPPREPVVASPLLPVLLVEVFPAVAGPVAPVLPDWVIPVVLASPDLAPEVEFDVVLTGPDWPPLPESPETATGLEVALPVSVEPVEPVFPEVALALGKGYGGHHWTAVPWLLPWLLPWHLPWPGAWHGTLPWPLPWFQSLPWLLHSPLPGY
jgi:hypothetical protein